MSELLEKIKDVVMIAGRRVLDAGQPQISNKEGIGNFVTNQDTMTQEFLYDSLKKIDPSAGFIGEEDQMYEKSNSGRYFVVDPIDGTANYIRDGNYSAISVGLIEEGVPVIGAVYNPWTSELYTAEKDHGAWLNGGKIHVSSLPLSQGIVIFGFTSYVRDREGEMFRIIENIFNQSMDMRCFGSAALDICGVAAGKWEGFMELKLYPWDYTAAMCILQEAGGKLTKTDGTSIAFAGETTVLAGTAVTHDELVKCCMP